MFGGPTLPPNPPVWMTISCNVDHRDAAGNPTPCPDMLNVTSSNVADDHAAQLAQARRARLAIWTAFLVGAVAGMAVATVVFLGAMLRG